MTYLLRGAIASGVGVFAVLLATAAEAQSVPSAETYFLEADNPGRQEAAEAQSVPPAETCVSASPVLDDDGGGDLWRQRYKFSSHCEHAVNVFLRYNTIDSKDRIICPSLTGDVFDYRVFLNPGETDTYSAGVLPRGIAGRMGYCSSYSYEDVQDATGYKSCPAANLPTCPLLR